MLKVALRAAGLAAAFISVAVHAQDYPSRGPHALAERARQLDRHHEPHRRGEAGRRARPASPRSEEHTSKLQSLTDISYAVFCLKKKKKKKQTQHNQNSQKKIKQKQKNNTH